MSARSSCEAAVLVGMFSAIMIPLPQTVAWLQGSAAVGIMRWNFGWAAVCLILFVCRALTFRELQPVSVEELRQLLQQPAEEH